MASPNGGGGGAAGGGGGNSRYMPRVFMGGKFTPLREDAHDRRPGEQYDDSDVGDDGHRANDDLVGAAVDPERAEVAAAVVTE